MRTPSTRLRSKATDGGQDRHGRVDALRFRSTGQVQQFQQERLHLVGATRCIESDWLRAGLSGLVLNFLWLDGSAYVVCSRRPGSPVASGWLMIYVNGPLPSAGRLSSPSGRPAWVAS